MVASADAVEPITGLPVFSLYGNRLQPSPESFGLIDVLLVDLPDVGTRVYTFAATMAYAMQAAAHHRKKVIVLDRPNPIGGVQVEGNVLHPEMASIVGPYPLPMRHGLTLGELARYYNQVGRSLVFCMSSPSRAGTGPHYFDSSTCPGCCHRPIFLLWIQPSFILGRYCWKARISRKAGEQPGPLSFSAPLSSTPLRLKKP